MEHLSIGPINPIEWIEGLATIGISPRRTISPVIFCCRHVPHSGLTETGRLTQVQRNFACPDYPTPWDNKQPCDYSRNNLPDLARTDPSEAKGTLRQSHYLPSIFPPHQPPTLRRSFSAQDAR